MMFLTKLMLLAASETDADLSTVLEETKAVAEEVHEDLQNLKPNVILETLKSWLPGLMSFGYRLVIAILILVIGNRIVHAVRKFLHKTFTHMNMDPSISRFLISVADACIYALAIFNHNAARDADNGAVIRHFFKHHCASADLYIIAHPKGT